MKPFLQGKKSLDASSLRAPSAAVAPVATAKAPACERARPDVASAAGAHVEVVKEGDKVVRLVITCVCGERVEVECLYPVGV